MIILKDKKNWPTFYTKNFTPGLTYFDEPTISINNEQHRFFDPRRSKLAAAILKGIDIEIKSGFILYLGASHGYTVSYISDMIRDKGLIFAVDFAPRVVRDLVFIAEKRSNIAPILADANRPEMYKHRITLADFIYQDVAQKNQAEIFIKNCEMFLKPKGTAFLAIKSRSIDITKRPQQIYSEISKKLQTKFTIIDTKVLDPYEKDHCVFYVKFMPS